MATQNELAEQMLQQLRILDPSVSGALGTPERKIIDTVAQALVDVQVDLTSLSGALDIDSKYGIDLDNFLNLFGFGRQLGVRATGVITFSRSEASNLDIRIPAATQVSGVVSLANTNKNVIFETTLDGILTAGELSVSVPIRAISPGTEYNVPTDTITQFVSAGIYGVTDVTNEVPTRNGLGEETDAEYKVRFKNTIFRNLAGTQDQYLALAVSGAFTNKANVVGPISRYREYIQIPAADDTTAYAVDGTNLIDPNGVSGWYTTALSTIPYSKHSYEIVPNFVSDSQTGQFYTEGIDYTINYSGSDKNTGDAYRLFVSSLDDPPLSATTRPNVTFKTVYTGTNADVNAPRPGDIVLFEHSYISSASRNDYDENINNCVDIYVNGANETTASTIIPRPTLAVQTFVDNSANKFHFDNFRRIGKPDARPLVGHFFTPLFQTPIESVPDSIIVTNSDTDAVNTYYEGEHYWGVVDVSDIGGTIRSRTGIEWSAERHAELAGDTAPEYSGDRIYELPNGTGITIDYTFDRNIPDLQAAVESSKQITTDVLVHKATARYFKFYLNVMYSSGFSPSATNASINQAISGYLQNQYFGATIQLSDILQVVHNVSGVDNVRWTHETDIDIPCVAECDQDGNLRFGIISDRLATGNTDDVVDEIQQWYLVGENEPSVSEVQILTVDATSGNFTLEFDEEVTGNIAYNADPTVGASSVRAKLEALSTIGVGNVSVTGGPGGGGGLTPYVIVFQNALGERNVSSLIPDNGTLSGGLGANVSVYIPGYHRSTITYDITFDGDTATVDWNADYNDIESAVRTAFSTPSIEVTGTGTPSDPFELTWPGFAGQFAHDRLEFTVNSLPSTTEQFIYNSDFTLRDDELPAVPSVALSTDTVAGVVIKTRAQSTWNSG